MSRIGKLPIIIPNDIKISIESGSINFTSKSSSKKYNISSNVSVEYKDNILKFFSSSNVKRNANIGMDRSNVNNIVAGMIKPFELILEFNGVGYKVIVKNNLVIMSLGFSHDIFYSLPDDVSAIFEKPNLLKLSCEDNILLGRVASEIKSFRKPEPYKGKGVKKLGEKILRKEGKKK